MATFAQVHAIKSRIAASLLRLSNIHGVGVGYRDPKFPKRGAALVIYMYAPVASTLRKSSTTTILRKQNIHVPVRLVRISKIQSHADYRSRIRPVPAGYSVGTIAGSGTVGLIVADSTGQRYIFSNNHVLTNPINARNSVENLQPGGTDGGFPATDGVGYLSRYVLLRKNASNLMDAALSTPARNSILSPRYPTVGVVPGHVTSYRIGTRFKKVGRTTGLRYGIVDSVNTDVRVDYGGQLGVLTFRGQTVVRGIQPISLPGDSGSVWLQRSNNFAAAVNYAGTDDGRFSIAFPIDWAMRRFRVSVAQPSTTGRVKWVLTRNRCYSRQLTLTELKSIKVLKVRRNR